MVHVVLVEPKGEENIGSVSRATMNMDVNSLVLVNPSGNHFSEKSLNYAVHAKEILQNALVVSDLKTAIQKN